MPPRVSVVMPVYNGEPYLQEAIDSVLRQTFGDLELLVIDDGSTDGSKEIVRSYSDPRLRFIALDQNRGLPFVRNIGLTESGGEYIAWADCDDINAPERVALQVAYMDSHPELGACGSYVLRFGGPRPGIKTVHTEHDPIRAGLLFRSEIMNPSAMIRSRVVRENDLKYRAVMTHAEDYDFWQRLCVRAKLGNIPRVLVRYRLRPDSALSTLSQDPVTEQLHIQIYKEGLLALGIRPTDQDLSRHRLIASKQRLRSFEDLHSCLNWLVSVREGCLRSGLLSERAVNREMFLQAFRLHKKAESLGLRAFREYYRNPFIRYDSLPLADHAKYFIKSLLVRK